MDKQQVRVNMPSKDRIELLRALRLVGNLGLKPAVELADYLNSYPDSVVAAGLEPEVAAYIAGKLRDAGAVVTVEPTSVDTPMLCCPSANAKYGWSFLRRVKRVAG